MTRAEFAPIYGFLMAQSGTLDAFSFIDPSRKQPLGVGTGSPIVSGAGQLGQSLTTTGWTASTTGILKAGDIFTIAGNTKVYMMTAQANSDGAGAATLSFSPGLVASPGNSAAITVANVPFNVSVSSEFSAAATTAGIIRSFELTLQEYF